MSFYVYILASRRNGTLYIGMTDDLLRRVWQHQTGALPGFTKKYGCNRLVYFEMTPYVINAIERETEIKKWNRMKKEVLLLITK